MLRELFASLVKSSVFRTLYEGPFFVANDAVTQVYEGGNLRIFTYSLYRYVDKS